MRARSVLGTLIIASLVGSVAPSFSAPAPKAGAACKKVGVTQTYKSKVFTCKKSGKKLVWSKGKAIKQAAPIPVATLRQHQQRLILLHLHLHLRPHLHQRLRRLQHLRQVRLLLVQRKHFSNSRMRSFKARVVM